MFLYAKLMIKILYEQVTIADFERELEPELFPSGPLRLDKVYVYLMKCLLFLIDHSDIKGCFNAHSVKGGSGRATELRSF